MVRVTGVTVYTIVLASQPTADVIVTTVLNVGEGSSATYTIVLASQPTADVIVTINDQW